MHVQVLQKNIYLCNGYISLYMLVTLRRSTLPDPKPRNPPLPEFTSANISFPGIFLHALQPPLTSPPPPPTWPPVSPDFAPPPLTETPNSIAGPVYPDHYPTTTLPKPQTWYPSPFDYPISKNFTPPLSHSSYRVDI